MKIGKFLVLVAFLGISGATELAQANPEPSALDRWRYAVSRPLPIRSPEERNRAASDALHLSEKILVAQGVLFERARIMNVEYDVFHLLPDSRPRAHRINQIAAEVDQHMRGLSLVYAPTVLMGGTAGFYSPKDHVMGISHEFLETGFPDSTYFHELVHASHAVARSEGKLDPLSPSAKVVKAAPGIRLSYHSKGYSRLQTFEEIEAHVESLARLKVQLPRSLPQTENEIRNAQELLNEIRFVAEQGESVALATKDLSARAITLLQQAHHSSLQWTPDQDAPKDDFPHYRFVINLDGYTDYRGHASPQDLQNAVELTWTLSPESSRSRLPQARDLILNLEKAIDVSEITAPEFAQVKESMFWFIERADARRTDFLRVRQAIDSLEEEMLRWKESSSPTPIYRGKN